MIKVNATASVVSHNHEFSYHDCLVDLLDAICAKGGIKDRVGSLTQREEEAIVRAWVVVVRNSQSS